MNKNAQESESDQPTEPVDAAPGVAEPVATEPVAAEPVKRSGLGRPILIGAASAVGVLLLAGAGFGVGLAVAAGDDDDRGDQISQSADRSDSGPDSRSGGSGPQHRGPGAEGSAERPDAVVADSDAASLVAAIDAAVAAASGTGATSIEVERGGWSVDVVTAAGVETDVFVALDLTATVRDNDADDDAAGSAIDTTKVAAIVDAALKAAGGGRIDSISSEDENGVSYDVTVKLNGESVDVDLSADLAVLSVDND